MINIRNYLWLPQNVILILKLEKKIKDPWVTISEAIIQIKLIFKKPFVY